MMHLEHISGILRSMPWPGYNEWNLHQRRHPHGSRCSGVAPRHPVPAPDTKLAFGAVLLTKHILPCMWVIEKGRITISRWMGHDTVLISHSRVEKTTVRLLAFRLVDTGCIWYKQ